MLYYLFAWSIQFLSIALILMIGAAPALVGVLMLARNQRNNIIHATYRQSLAATASIVVALAAFTLAFVETKVFSSQSFGNVMYLFAVQVAFVAWVVGYLFGLVIDKSVTKSKPVASWVKHSLKALILVFAFGVVRHVTPSVDIELVRHSQNNGALNHLAQREGANRDGNDEIAGRISLSRKAPESALEYLSKHRSNAIRLFVAGNPNTSTATLLKLSSDCNERVRLEAFKRILSTSASQHPTNCPDDHPPRMDTPFR
jgi:hypothetical protein